MTPEEYEAKVFARIDRLRARAERAATESQSLEKHASRMADVIPMGQPILVGHYSEGRDRRYRERIRNTYQRSYERGKEATALARRADAAESNESISSDDPRAVEKLRAKLATMERTQDTFRKVNATIRAARRAATKAGEPWEPRAAVALVAMGVKERIAQDLVKPDDCGRIGVADYQLSNLSGNMRRVRERIAILERTTAEPQREPEEHGDVTLSEDKDANRVQLRFPAKPSREAIAELKGHGFKWSPTAGVWQRQSSNGAWYHAQQIARRFGQKAEAAE